MYQEIAIKIVNSEEIKNWLELESLKAKIPFDMASPSL